MRSMPPWLRVSRSDNFLNIKFPKTSAIKLAQIQNIEQLCIKCLNKRRSLSQRSTKDYLELTDKFNIKYSTNKLNKSAIRPKLLISTLEDRDKLPRMKHSKVRKIWKKILRDMTDRIERHNICLIGIPERKNRKNKEVTIFS